nr:MULTISPECIES: ATP-binding protein [Streptomyces]
MTGTRPSLSVAACRAGFSVYFTTYFTTLDEMVRQLKVAEAAGRLSSKLRTYLRAGVLVVDEVGSQPLERAEANLVFQVISKRYEKGCIILTSNKTFSEWGQVFGDEVLATAILDRLLHHCDVVSINGPSYRLKNRLAAIERDADVA